MNRMVYGCMYSNLIIENVRVRTQEGENRLLKVWLFVKFPFIAVVGFLMVAPASVNLNDLTLNNRSINHNNVLTNIHFLLLWLYFNRRSKHP